LFLGDQEGGDRRDEDRRSTPIWTDYEAQKKIDVEMDGQISRREEQGKLMRWSGQRQLIRLTSVAARHHEILAVHADWLPLDEAFVRPPWG
jgi:hypothetical protein